MRSPSAADLVRIWELGRDRASWYRGLLLLAPGFPERTFRELAALTVGQRNICLFAVRERLFGPKLHARVQCPRCGAQSEFTALAGELCPHRPPADLPALPPLEFAVEVEGVSLRCRCLNSVDLADLDGSSTDGAMSTRPALLRRTILAARSGDADVPPDSLPPPALGAIADALVEHDPQAEQLVAVACADCSYSWSALFDPVSFIWAEVANAAQRLLHDVHLLARSYGWREADILAMSGVRRQFYLEKVAS